MGKLIKFPQSKIKTISSAKAYDATNMRSKQGSFDREYYDENWPEFGSLDNYMNTYGDGNWQQLGSAEDLSSEELEKYGIKAIKMYWDALKKKPVNTFEKFIDQIYFDQDLKQNFKEEDLPDFGKLVAMYLVDHPYPDENKLKEGFAKLAARTPEGMIPTKYSLGQVVAEASKETSFMDLFNITEQAVSDTANEFKTVAKTAALGVASYKLIGLATAALLALAALSGSKKRS